MNRRFSILLAIFLFMFLVNSALAENNEKTMIQKSSFFGKNIAKPRKIKKSGIIQLQPWEPYVKYAETVPNDLLKQTMLRHAITLNIDYDEIWVVVMDDLFTTAEKGKWKGQFDISTIYWKDSKVQAATLAKYFIFDPVTKKKVNKHKITQVWNRDSILKEVAN
jgi:hypothetical protein